jgi:CBS domain-containing protein
MVMVGELCTREVVVIRKEDAVLEAARRMREHHVGSLVVVEDRDGVSRPVGILTDRDIVVGVLATASPYLDSLRVGEIVTTPVVVAGEGDSLFDALHRMRAHGVRRLPVVGGRGELRGIISFDDVLELISEEMSELAALLARQRRRERKERGGSGSDPPG